MHLLERAQAMIGIPEGMFCTLCTVADQSIINCHLVSLRTSLQLIATCIMEACSSVHIMHNVQVPQPVCCLWFWLVMNHTLRWSKPWIGMPQAWKVHSADDHERDALVDALVEDEPSWGSSEKSFQTSDPKKRAVTEDHIITTAAMVCLLWQNTQYHVGIVWDKQLYQQIGISIWDRGNLEPGPLKCI